MRRLLQAGLAGAKLGSRPTTTVGLSRTFPPNTPLSINSSSTILTALYSTKIANMPSDAVSMSTYISPYHAPKPLDFMILFNRSNYAMSTGENALKTPWPDMKTIHVVQKGRDHVPGADLVIEVENWSSMDYFKRQFDNLAAKNPALRASMKAGRVGFYDVWSPKGEDPSWARQVIAAGFRRIGASPQAMDKLDKINLKKLCLQLGIPTAYFKEITPPDVADKEACIKIMAENTLAICQQDPTLAGKSIFLKHVNGGGGRGSQKMSDLTLENVQDVIRKIVNETGGNLAGVYLEAALDFKGRRLMQLELECNGEKLIEAMIRFVWFNRFYQKVFEVGCTKKASQRFIPPEIYEACRTAAQQLIQTSGYDNRGTIEILISTDEQGHYDFYVSEINMRRQVEAPAIEGLVADKDNRPRNTTAEQVMKSCGHPAPTEEDFHPAGPEFIGHVRLLCGQFSEKGTTYPNGLVIDGAFVPNGVDVQYVRGPLHLDADAQLGRALLPAQTWEELCDKLLRFAQEFQFYGPKTETSNYFDLFKKLAVDPVFRAGKLGCNETFNVFSNPPVEKGKNQKIVEALAYTVTPLITHGYRPGQGVKAQPYPTPNQIKEFRKFQDGLKFETVPQTPFSKWIEHRDFDRYILELKDHLDNHGGGTMTVMRDVLQSSGDQESALIQKSHTQLVEIHGAASGIIVASEEGGAQAQAGEMRGFDWRTVLLTGCPSNLMALWLMRSKWMNGLEVKSYAKQAFIAKAISNMIAQHYGWPLDSSDFRPWPAINFHAGNHREADRTNRLLLDAGIPVIPNFAWDPRYTREHIEDWIDCQLDLFMEAGKPLYQIRIKNPGQGPQWNADVIVRLVTLILHKFAARGLPIPIVHMHNHDLNGRAALIAREAIRRCQQMGYTWLIMDSAPPGTTHNSNRIVADALHMSPEEREHLMTYNHGAQLLLDLTTRFNNQSITKRIQDPNSEMAGGTNSSDLADAIKLGILPQDIPKAIGLAKALLGLGTPVTPFSEWIKQVGFAIWINKDIPLKTIEGVTAYIKNGGTLAIAPTILAGLSEWKTRLPRPAFTEQLLRNHNVPLNSDANDALLAAPLDIEADRAMLQKLLPNTLVTDETLATYYMFDKIGLAALQQADHSKPEDGPRNMTDMIDSPEFVHSQDKKVGDSFYLHGEKVTILKIQPDLETGRINIDYQVQGHIIRTSGINPNTQATGTVKQVRLVKDSKSECGAPIAGKLLGFLVKPGDRIKAGQVIARVEAMKMEHTVKAAVDMDGLMVDQTLAQENDIVEGEQVLATFKR